MTKPIPQLTNRGRVLVPYDNRVDTVKGVELVVLFFTPDTAIPGQSTLQDQLGEQGYLLTGYGEHMDEVHPYRFVEAARRLAK